jgi:hypothetical protein
MQNPHLKFQDGTHSLEAFMATLPKSDPFDEGELVEVFATQQESEAQVVQSLLEAAGIQTLLVSDVGPQDVLPVGGRVVRVAPEDAARAREVIAQSRTVSDVDLLDQAEGNAGPTEEAD